MPLPLLLGVAAAAMQPAQTPASASIETRRPGRAFVSPMGEPFYSAGAIDGLNVWFSQADANHDGSVTADEMTVDAARFFQTLDTNKDGEIDPDEITHYEQDIQARSGRYALLNIPEPVISADADFNRGVSAEEFRRAASKRFQLLDLSHTGRLTLPVLVSVRDAAADQAKRPLGYKPPPVQLDPQGDTTGAPIQH
jgi:Ca2+-binding EF-hand superfamily protein